MDAPGYDRHARIRPNQLPFVVCSGLVTGHANPRREISRLLHQGPESWAIRIVENPYQGMGFSAKTEKFAPETAAYRLFTLEIGTVDAVSEPTPGFTVAVVYASHLLDF